MMRNIYNYISEADDIEILEKNRVLLSSKGKRILLNGISAKVLEECYEIFGQKFRKSKYKKSNHLTVFWTSEEIEYLKENYLIKEISEIKRHLDKSSYQINLMLGKLKLIVRRDWLESEEIFFKKNINKSNIWLAEKLNRSVASIKSKKRIIKIKKDKEEL